MKIGDQISKELQDNLHSIATARSEDLWSSVTVVRRWEATMTTKQSINRWISTFCLAAGYSEEERKTFNIPVVFDVAAKNPKERYLYGLMIGKKTIIADIDAVKANKSIAARTSLLFDTALNNDFLDRVAALDDHELMAVLLSPLLLRIVISRFQYFTENKQEDNIPLEWQEVIGVVATALEQQTLWNLTYCRLGESEIETALHLLKSLTPLLTGAEFDEKFLLNERYLYALVSAGIYSLKDKKPFYNDGAYDSPMRIFVEALVVSRKSQRQFSIEKTKKLMRQSAVSAVNYVEHTFNSQWNSANGRFNDLSIYTFTQRYATLNILLNGRRHIVDIPNSSYEKWILNYDIKRGRKPSPSSETVDRKDSDRVEPTVQKQVQKDKDVTTSNRNNKSSFVQSKNELESSDPWLAFLDRSIFRDSDE